MKKIISVLLAVSLMFGVYPVGYANSDYSVELGDYIQFGKYNGEPIVWKVIHFDELGNPLLFSDKIISLKNIGFIFSGNPSSLGNYNWGRNNFYYPESTIRQWLNSSDKKIKWKTKGQFDMYDRAFSRNTYVGEQGFLSSKNFTNTELNMIKTSNNRVFLNEKNKDKRDGGQIEFGLSSNNTTPAWLCFVYINCAYDINWDYNSSYYNSFYYKDIQDKVFLLSHKQLVEYVYNRGENIEAFPTQSLVNYYYPQMNHLFSVSSNNIRSLSFDKNTFWCYWLSDGNAVAMDVVVNECVGNHSSSYDSFLTAYGGIRPALYLDGNLVVSKITSGSGTEINPYVVTSPQDTQAPTVPTNLVSSNVTSNGFKVSWTPSTDNVGVTGYNVYRDGAYVATVSQPSYTFANLPTDKTYNVTVLAFDGNKNRSAQSAKLPITLKEIDTQAPTVPTKLTTSNITSNGFTVSWTPSTDNVGVTGYNVYRNGAYVATVSRPSYAFTNLTQGVNYNITVLAFDASKNRSALSQSIAITLQRIPSSLQ